MTEIKRKTTVDFLYSETARKFVAALFLACECFFAIRFGCGIIEIQYVYGIIAAFTLYYLLNPVVKISPFDIPFFIIALIFFIAGIHEHMDNPFITRQWDYSCYAWIFPTVYILGKAVIGNQKRDLNNRVFWIVFTLGLGMFIQALLNYYNIYVGYFYGGVDYAVASRPFWSDLADGTRSTWGFGYYIFIGSLFYAFINRKKKKPFFYTIAISTVLAIFLTLFIGARQVFLVTVMGNAIVAILYTLSGHKEIIAKYGKIVLYAITSVAVILLISWLLIHNNAFGLYKIYEESFLARDGGILHNVRFEMWRYGIEYAFTFQKGGWDLAEIYNGVKSTHLLWLEYARFYDVSLFLLWIVFLLSTMPKHIITYLRYEKEYPVFTFAISAEIVMFLFNMIEPSMVYSRDLMVFFVFVYGINSGICNVVNTGEYQVLGAKLSRNKYAELACGIGMLSFALYSMCYLDWWQNRLNTMLGFVLPIFALLVGFYIANYKYDVICIGLLSILLTIIVLVGRNQLSSIETLVLLALPLSALIGAVSYYFKINKVILGFVAIIVTGLALMSQLLDGRIGVWKEVLRLYKDTGPELSWIASSDNTLAIVSSHNMWLEFLRDYGTTPFWILIAFEIWAIVCWVKSAMNNKSYSSYVALIAFVLVNYGFMLEADAFYNRYIFIIGLLIYGMNFAKDDNKIIGG